MSVEDNSTLREFERRLVDLETADYLLTLIVAGASDLSVRAIADVRALCDRYLDGRYRLDVVDVHRDPAQTVSKNVLAAPTLIRDAPLPALRLVGDLSNTTRVLAALEITKLDAAPSEPRG